MSKANGERMGQSLNYQSYLAKYVWYLIRCPTKGRPRDCVHPCPRYIHSGQCKPCTQFVELECYCEATGIVKPCKEWCDMGEEQKQLVKCCRVRCAKIMECGHQCPLICHPGRCADSYQCVENVMRYCNCERIERVFPCRGRGAKDQMVQCDHVCAQLLKTYKQAIAEMKNNPVKLTKGLQEADGNGSTANAKICTENAAVEEIKRILTGVSLSHDAKHESQSESGFNADKTEGDDQTEADAKGQQPHTEEATAVQDEAEICTGEDTDNMEPEIVSAEQKAESDNLNLVNNYDGEMCESPHSEESSRRSIQRASRSSSRMSSYSEEDMPRRLDEEKIVKIMRSSTRRKKLIECDQDIINEMQSSKAEI